MSDPNIPCKYVTTPPRISSWTFLLTARSLMSSLSSIASFVRFVKVATTRSWISITVYFQCKLLVSFTLKLVFISKNQLGLFRMLLELEFWPRSESFTRLSFSPSPGSVRSSSSSSMVMELFMFNEEETVDELRQKQSELLMSIVEEATDKLFALVGEEFKSRLWELAATCLELDWSSADISRR